MKNTLLSTLFICILCTSCGTLNEAIVSKSSEESIEDFTYVYIPLTGNKSGSSGVYGNSRYVYGGQTKSVTPSDLIAGYLMKKGYVKVENITPELKDKTLTVHYGETGTRSVGLGYAIEITLQFVSEKTNNVICISTAEGMGETEADDIRDAITRALDAIFIEKDNKPNAPKKKYQYYSNYKY